MNKKNKELKKKLNKKHFLLHKKWSFPLRVFSVNMTKSAVFCRFGYIYWRNTYRKTSFFAVSYWMCAFASKSLITAVFTLTLPTPYISENNIKIKINSNFYFHTSLRCLQRFYEGYEAFLYWEEWVEKSLISAEKRPQ